MTRDPISDALRSLPREKASEGFTETVMERLDQGPSHHRSPWTGSLLAAAAMATLVAGLWLVDISSGPESNERNARLEALESERQRLERELAEVRSLANQTPPSEIFLGGNDRVEVYFDVGWSAVQRADSEGIRSGITPASFPMNQSAGL